VLKLWNIWHDRIAAQALAPAMKGIQELIDAAEKNKIKPIRRKWWARGTILELSLERLCQACNSLAAFTNLDSRSRFV